MHYRIPGELRKLSSILVHSSRETLVMDQNDLNYHLQETGGSSNETGTQNENDRREDLPSGLNR